MAKTMAGVEGFSMGPAGRELCTLVAWAGHD